jgi:hypothetical protein
MVGISYNFEARYGHGLDTLSCPTFPLAPERESLIKTRYEIRISVAQILLHFLRNNVFVVRMPTNDSTMGDTDFSA